MLQPYRGRSHGNPPSLFFRVAVEVAQRAGETLAYDAVRFDEIVCQCRFAMVDVRYYGDEAGGLGRRQHIVLALQVAIMFEAAKLRTPTAI